jgi:CpXC protein
MGVAIITAAHTNNKLLIMPISYTEHIQLTCPACHADFTADAWTLIDAIERPDLAAELRDGTLNIVVCPQCGHGQPAGAPLLFHDPANRRVYFAVPPEAVEHRWREQAQTLLYALVGSLPEADRRPYLGDVQVEHELDGVRRAVLRRDRLRGRSATAQAAPAVPVVREPASDPVPAGGASAATPLVDAVRELLAADSEAHLSQVLVLHPDLLSDHADALIRQLADMAYDQGDRSVADALGDLRATLARMRSGAGDQGYIPESGVPNTADASDILNIKRTTQNLMLADAAYQALLQVAAPNDLLATARDYPALLEDWADADLTARIEVALDEGNERLARVIEARREALTELRARASGQDNLLQGAGDD